MIKKNVLIIGGLPPPIVGTTVRVELLINHSEFIESINCNIFDIIDRRSVDNMGKFEFINIYLGIKHSLKLFFLLKQKKYNSVFLSLAQNKWAFIRDSILIRICYFYGIKIVVHLDGGHFKLFYNKQNKIIKWYIKSTCNLINDGIVLGISLRQNFEGLIRNIHVINAGVPLIGKGKKNQFRRKILFLSNLFRSKGYIDVLKSIPLVIEKEKNVEFIFVGKEGKASDDSKDFNVEIERKLILSQFKINEYVTFLGPLYGEMRDEQFRKADIFVFPTFYIYEGKPAVVMQAMSAELPVITTRYPGSEDLIEDGINGFYVEHNNPNQIAEKIVFLLQNEDICIKMGKSGREKIEKLYDLKTHVKETVNILIK